MLAKPVTHHVLNQAAARCRLRAAGRMALVLGLALPAFGAGAVLVPPPQHASGQSTSPPGEEETHTDGEPRLLETRSPAPGPAPQRSTMTRTHRSMWALSRQPNAPVQGRQRCVFLPRRTAPPAPDDPHQAG
jgi:hypothetical protein